ncbi:MAG: 1-deoxy-D-xylulose-5-phosphate synthase [Spirochaetaceae bacterium]|jgi:1-deoxy-D-xylulose-5-phosphate synthase|nr:1-deoxy-D-xylulose-5-phosphate synthase [Spirochaetaceae bacterium]
MDEKKSLLEHINGPGDVKKLSFSELKTLAAEIRRLICNTVSENGGHLSSNLGVVELTIALHRVFDSPEDKIVWDVGHQCYTHKILTGRRADFPLLRQRDHISGFPRRNESPHDVFNTGHASTSISAALGFLAGERLSGGKNLAIAVIGDGALTGGMAYEALAHAGQLGLPLIVALNDNRMSISPNVGGLSKYLSHLSMKARYQYVRRAVDAALKKIPVIGGPLFTGVTRLKRAVKAVFYPDNFFVDLGFEYVGPVYGHNIEQLEQVLRDVRKLRLPVVVHVLTTKGKGYEPAEQDPSAFHSLSPASAAADEKNCPPSFTRAFGDAMSEFGKDEPRLVAVTAAMERGTGLGAFHSAYPERFFDAGIAEEHVITFAAALAARGMRPVAAIYSTFLQRSIDQIIHDVALQKLPVIFAVDRAGFVAGDGETHQGLFDISLLRAIPGMTLLAPASAGELRLMFEWALKQDAPCAIRYPKAQSPDLPAPPAVEAGRGVFLEQADGGIFVAFTGGLYPAIRRAAELLRERGVKADLYNLRFLKPVDEDYLVSLMNRYETAVFVEEGVKSGGFGEYASELTRRKNCPARILTLNAGDRFFEQGSREELLERCGLDGDGIADSICSVLKDAVLRDKENKWTTA